MTAAVMTAIRTAAANGVNRPRAISAPPANSAVPAARACSQPGRRPMLSNMPAVPSSPPPPNAPKSFWAPWPTKSRPTTRRSTSNARSMGILLRSKSRGMLARASNPQTSSSVAGWLLLRRTGIGWTDASADQPRRAVPCARELEPDGPCRRADHPRPLDDAERRAHLQGHLRPDGGAHAAPAAAALAAGRGPLRPRLSVLARRSRLRPRLPRPRAGAATRGREGEALGTGGADRSASARSLPAALGAVSDSRARGWAQGPAHEDPSLADRRAVRCGDHGRALRPRPRGPGAAGAERERRRPKAHRPGDAHPGADGPAALSAANASVPAASAAQPGRVAGLRRDSRHRGGREAHRSDHPAAQQPRERRAGAYHVQGAQDLLQRPDLTAPALRLRPAHTRRGQGGQEQAPRHGQRRGGVGLRRGGSELAAGARRLAARSPGRPGARIRADRRADGHLREPDHVDERAVLHQRARREAPARENSQRPGGDEGAPPGPAGRAAPGHQPLHPARRLRPRGPCDLRVLDQRPWPADVEPRRIERARTAVPSLLRWRQAGRQLSGLGDHGRHGPQHDGDELLRQDGLRHRRRPRSDAGSVVDARPAARLARGAEVATELTELVDFPGGRAYEQAMRPGIADAGSSGRCRLDAISRWLQDIAYLDLIDAGFEGQGAWIVRRTRIRVDRFPRFGEELALRTFCSGFGRFSAERRTSIGGESAAVEAVSLWICLDPERGRPMRFPPEFAAVYEESAAGRDANVRLRHPEPPADAERSSWLFRASEVDGAEHINNSHYWTPLEEELAGGPEPESIDAEIEYRDPAMPGEVALLRQGSSLWISGADGTVNASLIRA